MFVCLSDRLFVCLSVCLTGCLYACLIDCRCLSQAVCLSNIIESPAYNLLVPGSITESPRYNLLVQGGITESCVQVVSPGCITVSWV